MCKQKRRTLSSIRSDKDGRYYDTHESLHGYEVIVFCDDGVTGTHFDRPKFDELIEMARNQEIHCIMVKDYCAIIGLNQKDLENQGILA